MIQRKQTLFLLGAVIAFVLCLFLPLAGVQPTGMGAETLIHNLGLTSGDQGISFESTCLPLFLLVAVSAVLALVTIFMYKNRKLQMTLCSTILLFSVLWYIDFVLIFFGVVPVIDEAGKMQLHFGACLPLIAIILTFMAKKGVEADEKLVRAADRIR